MNKGFTTGSCAAAASKAAAFMLLSGQKKLQIEIDTPAGVKYNPQIEEIEIGEGYVSCAVRKQSGDDPDITNGTLVFSRVSYCDGNNNQVVNDENKHYDNRNEAANTNDEIIKNRKVYIDGGKGVGRVTRPGLDQPVGNAAINSVPRKMIEAEVKQVMDLFDYDKSLEVIISVPEGEELAAKTFNPRLGIEGGISIIGTTGIVEPMSTKALLDTIMVELRQMKAMGASVAVASPGNYGLEFMKEAYDYDLDKAVKCSNFIGDTIDMAAELGFKKLLLCGHVGKLIKVSGGIMNTHSKEADCRMELMAAAAIKSGASADVACEILDCVSTEEAMEIYLREGIDRKSFDYIMERIDFFLRKRAAGRLDVECVVYSNQYGLLGKTAHADEFLREAKG